MAIKTVFLGRNYSEEIKRLHFINWSGVKTYEQVVILMYFFVVREIHFSHNLLLASTISGSQEILDLINIENGTNNLVYSDYFQFGNHSEFLMHFLHKKNHYLYTKDEYVLEFNPSHSQKPISIEQVLTARNYYMAVTRAEHNKISVQASIQASVAMNLLLREEDLGPMYVNMLEQIPLFKEDLPLELVGAFKYFLQKHIEFYHKPEYRSDLSKQIKIVPDTGYFYLLEWNLFQKVIFGKYF
ncbi:MAG: hypothetical protein NTZ44_04125 [Candidatus Nomurabacteria bacterium]|nr:hypothetical protein [Candidatus Nomurabacteria bacterium]